jgi:hypothetical protein
MEEDVPSLDEEMLHLEEYMWRFDDGTTEDPPNPYPHKFCAGEMRTVVKAPDLSWRIHFLRSTLIQLFWRYVLLTHACLMEDL